MTTLQKIFILLLCFLLAALMFTLPAYAADEPMEQVVDTGELSRSVPDSAVIADMDVMDALDTESWLGELWEQLKANTTGAVAASAKNVAALLAVSMLCALAGAVYKAPGEGGPDFVTLAGVLAVTALSAGTVTSFMDMAVTALNELNTFSKALLPTLTAAAAGAGAVTSAPAKFAASMLFMDGSITLSTQLIMPLICAYLAASTAGCALGGGGLDGAARLIKRIVIILLTAMTIAFTAFLALSGIVTETTDATTAKVAKTVIGAALPVVGGIISDAAGTVISGAGVLKNAVGLFGLCTVCAVCLLPFLRLAVSYILYKLAAALAAPLASGGIAKAIDAVGTVFGMALGLVGADALMLFFSVISFLKVVSV